MEQKGFRALDDVRGKLAVPSDTDETGFERTSYVGALQEANSRSFGPW
jgi:hypothetical protein